ncbi:MAG: type II secretion system protein [Alphaproteobacteria bacterium]|nr:type II secretion system protein [Alphaproteobacteria bacterium]
MKSFTLMQSGRSMIEMLGVLAIVGILSVGALSGYSMAMSNLKANEAINEIRHYMVDIRTLFADKKICVKILTAGWYQELGDGLKN